ncbi:MAG: hypothetical protein U0990_01035 [Candidatus Nanopelagicales bacterium]|nr:hypothetical protein [Candidatus Nanopelagicales bacterium]MDZ4248661.1 hypothetical protein [Candidatus Nanopelagicales bacterium]
MASDRFSVVAQQPEVVDSAAQARAAVDELLWNRAVRRVGPALAAESALVGAWCDAAFEGAETSLDSLRAGTLEDSPMGRVAAQAVSMYARIPELARVWDTAPGQVLAGLHSTVASGMRPDEEIGRPRSADIADDPLRLPPAPLGAEAAERLARLTRCLGSWSQAPAIVVAGFVHGEIASLRPFSWGSGLVARAMTRLVLRAKGVDPDSFSIPEAGFRALGRPRYVAALRGFGSGEVAGVTRWLCLHNEAVRIGAREAAARAAELPES